MLSWPVQQAKEVWHLSSFVWLMRDELGTRGRATKSLARCRTSDLSGHSIAASTGLWPPLIFSRKYSSLTALPPYFGSSSLNLHQAAASVQRSMEGNVADKRESPHAWKCSLSEFKRVPSMSTVAKKESDAFAGHLART